MPQVNQADTLDFTVITGDTPDPYRPRVERLYDADSPEVWRQILGEDMWFQFGIYEECPTTSGLNAAGRRYLERQLDLADACPWRQPPIRRVLDLGCGWGPALRYLPERLPNCPRFDAINISARQLTYVARRVAENGQNDLIRLYQCNGRDIGLLPDPEIPYDLVLIRGVINHMTYETYETTMAALATRMRPGGAVVISDNVFNVDLDNYHSAIPDTIDRQAVKHRKTLAYFTHVLADNGFVVRDLRRLPSTADSIYWMTSLIQSTEKHFEGKEKPTAFAELTEALTNWITAMTEGTGSIYSIIATFH